MPGIRIFGTKVPIQYGKMLHRNGSTAQNIGVTPVTLTWETSYKAEGGVVIDPAAGTIWVPSAGLYQVFMSLSFSGSASIIVSTHLYVNGSASSEGFHRALGGGDVGSASFMAIEDEGAGTTFEVKVAADGASKEITPVDGQFIVRRVG